MITQDRAEELANKLLQNKMTPDEEKELQSWYNDNLEEPVVIPKSFASSKKAHQKRMLKVINRATTPTISIDSLWPRIAAAAAILLVVGAGFFYFNQKPAAVQLNAIVRNDIAPGKVGATLTLANGKKIKLTDAANGELAQESGISITKTADGQLVYEIKEADADPNKINTLSTAKGETYKLRLPDGSLVYLNAASSLTYAASLIEHGKRTVRLRGEGYFEISKDKKHPFVVKTDKQEVEVLGTHFNINTYADEPVVKTTLLEGSVRVVLLSAMGSEVMLKPSQQATVTGSSGIIVKEVDVNDAVDWKNNEFVFKEQMVAEIMRKLSRWYDVEVIYENGTDAKQTFSGKVSRLKNISEVLRIMQSTGQIKFKIEGKKVWVGS